MMRQIEIDEDVFSYLQKNAIPYIDRQPNDTLRRLFGLNKARGAVANAGFEELRPFGRKRPKTKLSELTAAGILKEGQKLILHDHRSNPVSGIEAFVRGDMLEWKGATYSMTALAKKHLREICHYQSPEFQGPRHWYTESKECVFDLWKKYLGEK